MEVYPGRNGYTLEPVDYCMAVERVPPGTRVATMPRYRCVEVGVGAPCRTNPSLSSRDRASKARACTILINDLAISYAISRRSPRTSPRTSRVKSAYIPAYMPREIRVHPRVKSAYIPAYIKVQIFNPPLCRAMGPLLRLTLQHTANLTRRIGPVCAVPSLPPCAMPPARRARCLRYRAHVRRSPAFRALSAARLYLFGASPLPPPRRCRYVLLPAFAK